jgi:glycosyltransferase involved in cell wall biosynthesis
VIPILHYPNHEISLITKVLEYSHARLPIVVSDVKAMSETVRKTGQGEVFVAEDVTDFVRAVSAVLADPQRYRSAYQTPGLLEQWTWRSAADALDGVYTRLRAEQRQAKGLRLASPRK